MKKGDYIFGFFCGIIFTVVVALLISGSWDFSEDEKQAVINTFVEIKDNQNLETGFNPNANIPHVNMLYRYDNGDVIFATTDGALVWYRQDRDGKRCYGAPDKYVPRECRVNAAP